MDETVEIIQCNTEKKVNRPNELYLNKLLASFTFFEI